MPKRKRDNEDAVAPSGAVRSAKQQRVRHHIKHGTVKLGHAFKVAKGFERQKLGRRHKKAVAEKNEKDVHRIEAEVAAIKTLDTTKCAHIHLCKILIKVKAIDESGDLPSEVRQPATLSSDAAVLNVHARLCKSNPVKEALPDVLAEIHRALGLKYSSEAVPKTKRVRAKDYEAAVQSAAKDAGSDGTRTAVVKAETNEEENVSREHSDQLASDVRSHDDLDRPEGHLASSDDETSGAAGEGGDEDIATIERQLEAEGIARKGSKKSRPAYDHAADLSVSEEEEDSFFASASPEPRKAPPSKKQIIIPSLMGGYISDSGTDIDDIDEAPKKNRRGQRARQAIWEKKFGVKANHMQKPNRNAGWDPKRGAVEGSNATQLGRGGRMQRGGGGNGHRAAAPGRGNDGIRAGPAPVAAVMKTKESEGPIHPSWEAAKKAKEKKQTLAAFQGKKVTFD
ncbi:hypothetical protein LTR78_001803 [Recurvomyces mirabilis]|uniref:Bud22 domain-containing protein n=1 Tax=Recurvomyces mirabilis TaxID=574656 RepID=A0AAE0WUL3_9PEZI|nr:hypothetical protein LTR78_001803 [Recurvomyces mirabilis]